jgi:hypothetical protein
VCVCLHVWCVFARHRACVRVVALTPSRLGRSGRSGLTNSKRKGLFPHCEAVCPPGLSLAPGACLQSSREVGVKEVSV